MKSRHHLHCLIFCSVSSDFGTHGLVHMCITYSGDMVNVMV